MLAGRERAAVRSVLRRLLDDERVSLVRGGRARGAPELAAALGERLDALRTDVPPAVINATGVLLHTNLGRAPWPAEAIEAARRAASGYLFLELDPASGRRAARFPAVEEHLTALTGAEAAYAVNNNAAALALAVSVLARRAAVLVSRGELAEIGGGVRIPEVIRRAGARLVEVGTTNRTRLVDYVAAFDDHRVGAILRVHASNFRIDGFTERPALDELGDLARQRGVPLVEDLGSGALLDTARFGIAHEPLPEESIRAGVDLVTFSGDKLLGGPQAGLIVGRAQLVGRLRRDPLARAMRPDKVTLAALAATLAIYRGGEATAKIPVWRMLVASGDELGRRAEALSAGIRPSRLHADVRAVQSTVGGGSLPGELLPSLALAIASHHPDRLHRRLRTGVPGVIGRIEGGILLLDLRTVLPEQDDDLVAALCAAGERAK